MTTALLVLTAFTALFLLPIIVFKSNSAILFLASCAGMVIVTSLEPSVVATAGSIIPFEGENVFRLLVVVLPVVFASAVFKGVVHGPLTLLHVLLGLISGFALWVVLPTSISLTFFTDLRQLELWQDASEFTTLALALGLLLSLTLISLTKSAHHGKKHH